MRLTLADIIDFLQVNSGDSFDVSPEDAIAQFAGKGLKPSFSYADLLGDAHTQAFTVAKMMDVDMLNQVRTSLEAALANGQSYKEWANELMPMLQASGWWGKQKMLDPATGKIVDAQLGSAHRLETIFRTNMQAAYATQQWQMIEDQKDVAPFLMYDAVDDFRTRPSHKARDNTILPVDDPWWDKNTPPLGYNCRCGVIQLSQDELDALGKDPNKAPPALGTYQWKNPRTGHTHTFPEGIDPGFDYNVGKKGLQGKLDKLLQEKIGILPPDMQKAVKEALKKGPGEYSVKAIDTTIATQKALAEAKAAAAIERAKAIAAEKAAQAEAKAAIKEISGAPAKGPTLWTKKAHDQLVKGANFDQLAPTEQLAQIKAKAKELSDKNKLAGTLSSYKKQVLEGKTPTPAQKKAFNSLSQAEQDSFLAKIDKELQAKKAAEQAALAKKLAEELAAKTAAEKAAQEAAAAAAKKASANLVKGTPPDMANLVQIGPQKGSNPGGLFQDTTTGEKWYIKTPKSEDIARNEVLGAKLYELAGIDVPELHLVVKDGQASVASKIVDGLEKGTAAKLAKASGAADGFVTDAWLANWDVVGLDYDNLLVKGSRAFRVDTGGALRYRAQGGLKGGAFGDTVGELDSLRNPADNEKAASVFGKLTQTQLEASAKRVLSLADDDIRAVVDAYGPADAAERKALADRLLARKKDIAKRFPNATVQEAPAPVPGAAERVTKGEQALINDARVNGYGIKTDKDQIEDQMVLVSIYTDQAGKEATRGWLKLRPDAAKDLAERIRESAGVAPVVELAQAREAMMQAVKGINMRAKSGEAFMEKDLARVQNAITAANDAIARLQKGIAEGSGMAVDKLHYQLSVMKEWLQKFENMAVVAKPGVKAQMFPGLFPYSGIPDAIEYQVKAAKKAAGLAWKRGGHLEMETGSFSRGHAKMSGRQSVPGVGEHYYAELPDGGRVVFVPDTEKVGAYAMRGTVSIDVPGKAAASSKRIFDELEGIGIDGSRASDLDRDNLYLNGYARLKLARSAKEWADFMAIDKAKTGAEAVKAKLEYLKKATGVDIEKSDGWATRSGVYQAFGHGRAYQFRPDLDTPEFREFAKNAVVYHNPMGLSKHSGSSGVWGKMKPVIEGGGQMASLADRVRRGVPLDGSSVSSDFNTGGASYLFTRIKSRGKLSAGYYWRPDVLKRMDAITYDGDNFGRVTPGHIESNRVGQTVEDFKGMTKRSSDETIFKNGLSLFDDLEMVVLKTKTERDTAIKEMKAMGYSTWPDGRKLEDVFKWEGEFS